MGECAACGPTRSTHPNTRAVPAGPTLFANGVDFVKDDDVQLAVVAMSFLLTVTTEKEPSTTAHNLGLCKAQVREGGVGVGD